jgi:hypothetical protein
MFPRRLASQQTYIFNEGREKFTATLVDSSAEQRANVTGLGARKPRAEELALPKSVETGNLGLNKAVIRWMSA